MAETTQNRTEPDPEPGAGAELEQAPGETEESAPKTVPRPNRKAGLSGQSEDVLMAMNLYAEARGEYVKHGADALYAVGRVVMNRVASASFPSSVSGVILQASQFSWTRKSDPNYAEALNPSDAAVWAACYQIGSAVMAGGGADPAPGADHYHANNVSPGWAKKSAQVARIGSHTFYDLVSDDNAGGSAGKDKDEGEFKTPKSWTPAPPIDAIKKPGSNVTIHLGHQGPAVEEIQRLVNTKDDSWFGKDTAKAVVDFKKSRGLGNAEKVGHTTWTKLVEARDGGNNAGGQDNQGEQLPTPRPRPDTSGNPETEGPQQEAEEQPQAPQSKNDRWKPAPSISDVRSGAAVIDYGMEGDSVKEVQRLILVGDDGKYGNGTRTGVRTFKASHGLTGGDQVGVTTLQKMEEVAAERGNISGDSAAQMAALLTRARSSAGRKRPGGWCYRAVKAYINAVGYGKIGRGQFWQKIPGGFQGYARNFAEYVHQGTNAEKLGLKDLGLSSPYDAPAGAIVVVAPRSPGTRHPTAGDISVAGGDGTFYNDGNMGYRGRDAWPPARGGVLGVFVPDI